MSDAPQTDVPTTGTAEGEEPPYDVVVLVEQELSAGDAERIAALHRGITEETGAVVRYHLLLPVDDAAAAVHAAMGSMASQDALAAPAPPPQDLAEVDGALREEAQRRLGASLDAMAGAGAQAAGATVPGPPVDALRSTVSAVGAREAVVITERHVVAEFLSVDWASRAQRHLGIPVLHLVEHETFAEQAGDPGGVTGL
ncbi:hypothetical protein [Nocardioides sp. CFH 31398]|uniref:hypothetical protein n=1 Tax=Nocardioides sp. CFH 31398 TaxID=2919579 RepID=UPI001F06AC1D|nr:hypothetical protein [Nocardioides sp. CFH 31398]MCH1865884.1 hypothetical protein [Nocardioides sp. CFH 31398]